MPRRLSSYAIVIATFVAAGILCLVAAGFAATVLEENTEIAVRRTLDEARHDWAEVHANGLRVILTGTAPDEARRFEALSNVGAVVDAARIIDAMKILPGADLAPPRFSAEILRNDSGISIIGLIPAATDRDDLIADLAGIVGQDKVTDLLETANYPVPRGWNDALDFAINALSRLPRSKISVDAGRIEITAISDSAKAKRQLEASLNRDAPRGLRMALDISAPRPVITPFTLRFLIDGTGGRFDACSADTEEARDRILDAARAAGLAGTGNCVIGMGVPSPRWAEAASLSILALEQLGRGSVTLADADISLVASADTDHGLFDRVIGELEAALPDVFALHAVLPEPEVKSVAGPPEFVATRSPEGLVQLRGRLTDETMRHVADSYAKAKFGSEHVFTATRLVPDLPGDWEVRVLAGLESLAYLVNGAVTVTPDTLTLRGITEQDDANAEIARLLAERLGEGESYDLDITYRAPPEPVDPAPSPELCEAELAGAQQQGKITFEPGSATIAAESLDTMEAIAGILDRCGEIRLEIQGHTDSQGRESMNQQLSQARAQSVLNELRARRVLTATYSAVGYGEAQPIADNDTEEGREINRRIEFRLLRPEPTPEAKTTLEAAEQGLDTMENATGDGTEPPQDEAETVDETGETDTGADSGEGPDNEQN